MKRRAIWLANITRGMCVALLWASGCAEPQDAASTGEALVESELASSDIASGAAFAANDTRYYTFGANTRCRDGSPAGITVRTTNSDKLVIYLKGGGSCFDPFSCTMTAAFLSKKNIPVADRELPTQGIFDASHPESPIHGWNVVYVPYCTGDMHLGTRISGSGEGVDAGQYFYGRKNLDVFLKSVVTTFKDRVNTVLVAGESSGGAAAGGSAIPVQNAFIAAGKNPNLRLLDDSGPFLSAGNTFATDYFPTCAQAAWRNVWGLDASVLADCGAACRDAAGRVLDNWVPSFAGVVTSRFTSQNRKPALLVSYKDAGLGILFGNAKNMCRPPFGNVGYSMEAALSDLRARHSGKLRTYYVDSIAHTWILAPGYWTTTQSGVSMNAWLSGFIQDTTIPETVGP